MNPEIPKGEALPDAPSNPSTGTEANQPSERLHFLKGVLSRTGKRHEQAATSDEKPPLMLQFRAAHENFAQRYPELAKTFDDIFRAFNSELLVNSSMYETADGQTTFPYTSINVAKFAKKISRQRQEAGEAPLKYPGAPLRALEHGNEKYFIVGSHLIERDGQFTYSEIAFHEFMKNLPTILQDLQAGKGIPDVDIVITGAPTSMFGHVTREFAERVHGAPLERLPQKKFGWFRPKFKEGVPGAATETYASMYKEFVEEQIRQDQVNPADIHVALHGYSMGSSWCAKVKEMLKTKGIDVLMDSPAGLHGERVGISDRMLDVGFGIDSGIALATRSDVSYFIINEPNYWERITKYLIGHNGYKVSTDPEQSEFKKQIIADTVRDLRRGIPVDKDANVFVRQGKKDLSMTTVPFLIDAAKRQTQINAAKFKTIARSAFETLKEKVGAIDESEKRGKSGDLSNSLGRDRLPGRDRTFAIESTHVHPFYRKNELKRWERTTRMVDNLIKQGRIKLPESIVSDKPFPYLARVKDIVSKKIGKHSHDPT